VRRWAPTAVNAVAAFVPAGALLSAAGAAGSGYLLQRADIAAAGAGTAAVGLAVERLQNRSLRQRARRERWQWRAEREQLRGSMDELHRDLADAHQALNVLRSRIDTLNERAEETSRPALVEFAARQRPVSLPRQALAAAPATGRPVPAEPERRRPLVTLAQSRVVPGTGGWHARDLVTERPAGQGNHHASITLGPLVQQPNLPALPLGPGAPTHPGAGMPLLPPGPRDPVSGPLAILADLAGASRQPPSAPLPAATVDAMVRASSTEARASSTEARAEADEFTVTSQRLGDPDLVGRRAGPVNREDAARAGGLVVVGASVVGGSRRWW